MTMVYAITVFRNIFLYKVVILGHLITLFITDICICSFCGHLYSYISEEYNK